MNIVLMGKPGCGKGTISNRLVKEFGYKLICAGDLLRDEKSTGSDLGKKIANIIDKGNLVPDWMVTNIVYKEFKKPSILGNFFLIDGYPRTVKQAFSLDEMINIELVLWINISDETSIKRNLNRGLTSGRPDDANEEVIKKRLNNYKDISLMIRDYYQDHIVDIDGEGSPDEVYKKIVDTLFETIKEARTLDDILD